MSIFLLSIFVENYNFSKYFHKIKEFVSIELLITILLFKNV